MLDNVSLREITAETVRAVTNLSVTAYQNRFVAPNAVSLAQALFAPAAWYRAIYLGNELVGFVMLEDKSLLDPMPESPTVGVWRFMIDARYQQKGVGRAAMLLVIEHVRRKGLFKKLALSYVPDAGGPEALYISLGFRPTGDWTMVKWSWNSRWTRNWPPRNFLQSNICALSSAAYPDSWICRSCPSQ